MLNEKLEWVFHTKTTINGITGNFEEKPQIFTMFASMRKLFMVTFVSFQFYSALDFRCYFTEERFKLSETVAWRYSVKKLFWKISQNSWEITWFFPGNSRIFSESYLYEHAQHSVNPSLFIGEIGIFEKS